VLALIFGAAGALIGLAIGWILGTSEAQATAEAVRAANPEDPLDGLAYIALGYMFMGTVIGAFVGVFAAILLACISYARREYGL
jgi:hypothetical protein